jgi:hypothetical protein
VAVFSSTLERTRRRKTSNASSKIRTGSSSIFRKKAGSARAELLSCSRFRACRRGWRSGHRQVLYLQSRQNHTSLYFPTLLARRKSLRA